MYLFVNSGLSFDSMLPEEENLRTYRIPVKAQGAMEYLMTYGWAVLILGIGLAALYQLGVFNAANVSGASCVGVATFVCQTPTLTTVGTLTFTFGQNSGFTIYNVQLACAGASSGGLPSPLTAFNSISSIGTVLPPSNTGNTIVTGATLTISALPCYSSKGALVTSMSIGQQFSGGIWLNYTTKSAVEDPVANPWVSIRAANLRLTAT